MPWYSFNDPKPTQIHRHVKKLHRIILSVAKLVPDYVTYSFFGASSLKICTVSVLLDAHKNNESWLKASELMVTHLDKANKIRKIRTFSYLAELAKEE